MLSMAKPVYISIVEYSPNKPVIIFVPARRQCHLTASDILTICIADNNEHRFLNLEPDELEPHLRHVSDESLVELLRHGIGYYHTAMDLQDRKIVERLFQSGAIQLLVADKVSIYNQYHKLIANRLLSRRRLGVCLHILLWSSL
jgi:pre-mRNA-splicing helicase BRR2